MPRITIDGLTINYDVQGEGEPLLLIPYLSADHASYAFQLPAYTEHFSCIALDLPGTGESDKPCPRFEPGSRRRFEAQGARVLLLRPAPV
jgi:pimeloyl-ACP methyl ester carboxylesterase